MSLPSRKTLTLAVAREIAHASERFAAQRKLNVVIAVLDDGANLIYLARMDQALLCSVAISQQKARTSVLFKAPSKDFETGLMGGLTPLLGLDVLPFAGGVPLKADGDFIGSIGVSGATAPEDEEIAEAGARALQEILAREGAPE